MIERADFLAGPDRAVTRYGEAARFREGLYRVADGCFAYMVPNGSWGETNLGLIAGDGKSVLVDTAWDVRLTREILDLSASVLARAPVETVVNSHADGDHWWGNQLLAGRAIVATEAACRQMHHLPPGKLVAFGRAGRLMRRLPVAGLDRLGRYAAAMVAPYRFDEVAPSHPTEHFSGERTLSVGGREVVLHEVGPGHTDGDLVVHVPDARVAYAADILFVGVTPVAWSGPVEKLIGALRWVLTLDVDVFVPGHGPLAARADVQRVIDYWEFCRDAVDRARAAGMAAHEAARAVVTGAAFRERGYLAWDSPERLVTSAHTLYRDWGADTGGPPGTLGVLNLQRRQARLAFDLPDATPAAMHRL